MAAIRDWIRLFDLRFRSCHGVLDYERSTPQPFTVEIALGLDLAPAGRSDRLEDTINYARAVEVVASVLEGPPARLLESLAARIAQGLLSMDSRIVEVAVRVRKDNPPVSVLSGPAEVEIHRHA
ncbi:MAG: dihydroneopterin aldolase [Thermaerobacter sp.]|nr:dihydroneopterin aldolase [Thermaerobacter sp.]